MLQLKLIFVCGFVFLGDCFYVKNFCRDCTRPVGVENRNITDQQMLASSRWNQHYASNARLNNQAGFSSSGVFTWGGWCTDKLDKKQFLQIDLGSEQLVSGVATQGYVDLNFVLQYKVSYSINGRDWQTFKQHGTNVTKTFQGNRDCDTIIKNFFTQPIKAKYIRFNPVSWNTNGFICMRVEVYECIEVYY